MASNPSMRPAESYEAEFRAAQQTIKFFEELLRTTADGILVTDTAQNIILANEAFCALFGRSSREVIETNLFVWLEQLGDNAPRRWSDLEKRVSIEEICRDVEFTIKDRTLSVTASLLNGEPEGTSRSIISIWHDVTQRKNLAKFPSENPYPVLRIAKDGTVLFANSAASPLLEGGDIGQVAPAYWKKLSADVLERGGVRKNVEIEHEGKILSFTGVPVPEGDYVNLYGLDVTERKEAELALRNSEEQFRLLVSDIKEYAIFSLNPDGLVLSWNQGAERIKGYESNEIIGQHFSRFYTPEDIENGKPEHELKVATESGRYQEEGWRVRKDGSRFWADVVITSLRDDKGTLKGFAKVTRDVTERRRAEEQIANLAKFPAENPFPVLRIAGNGTVLFANSAAQPLLEGADVGQVAPDYWKKLSTEALKIGEVRKNVEIEHEGKILSFTGVPVPEGDYVNLYGLDVTERKRAEEQIKNLAKFPAENPSPVLRIAADGTVLFANSAAQPLLDGGDVGQAAPDYWKKLSADALKSGKVKKNVEIEREDRILAFTAVPVVDGDYTNLYGLDVTERKWAENAVVESELRYRTLFEQSPNAVLIIDPETARATQFNEAACRQLGYSREEFANLTIYDYEVIEAPEETRAHMEKISREGGGVFETKHRAKGGEILDVLISSQMIQLAGRPVFLSIVRDVTTQKRAKELSDALNEINNDINSTLDFDQIMENVVIEATKAIGAEACGIVLRERDSWCVHHVYGFPQDLVGSKFTDEDLSHIVLAVQTRKPVVVNDALNDKRVDHELMEAYGVRSTLTIPLMVKEEAFGVLAFSYQSDPVAFTDLEIDFAEKLGVSLSLAIQNARSHEMTEQSLSDTQALRRLSSCFTQTLELDEILDTALSEISAVLAVQHGCIYVFDQAGSLVIRTQQQLARQFLEAKGTISAHEGCAGRAVATQEVFAPAQEEHAFICEDSERFLGLDCLAAIPITSKGMVLGVLELFAPVHRRLSDRERRIVMTMSDQLAAAIENANLYSKERNIANTLQETLLTVPEKIEGISFGHLYRSATAEAATAGGDFYDLFELEHDKVGIVIGDVSGKGLEAASLTSLVKNTIKAYAYEHFSPAKVVAMTNDVVMKASSPSTFVTLFFGILDKESGVLLYCNAGHPQPIRTRKLSAASLLKTGSPVVGVFEDIEYKDFEETLQGGDILFLYTDGAIEARHDRELFGEERLVGLVKDLHSTEAQELPQRVFDKLFDFAQGTMADDTALLAISLEKEATTKDKALEVLAKGLMETLDVAGVAIMLIDPQREHVHGAVGKPAEHWPDINKVAVSLNESASLIDALKSKSPIVVDNTEKDPRAIKWLVRNYKCKSVLYLPIYAGQEVFGVAVAAESRRFRHFSGDEVDQAQLLASITAERLSGLEPMV